MTYSIKAGGSSHAINPSIWHPVARHYRPAEKVRSVLGRLPAALNGAVSHLVGAIRTYRQRKLDRAAIEYMLGLEDHMLDDIGLTRRDVEWANRLPLSVNAATELELKAMVNRKEWKR